MDNHDKKCWVLVSSLKENTNLEELERLTPLVKNLIDEWQTSGKIMWSGSFEDNNTGMAVFEATHEEAQQFYEKYRTACSNTLDYQLHQWNAMPILSILSK